MVRFVLTTTFFTLMYGTIGPAKNLLAGESKEAHASRLKFYVDSSLGIPEDLLAHVAHKSEGHVVEELRKGRFDMTIDAYHLYVKWCGLCDVENMREPMQILLEDVPAVVKRFVLKDKSDSTVKGLVKAHGIALKR
ncbi:hypothetical protein PHMEG_00026513 [Phytophthora megakarya]|uniref:Uncharacterized protein n=1 Tax=Phytophthora megakarya TaxID=4795 RepID=A0A225V9G1_9STRA|nr:hypothetical protein PHMEG_00026513 [Phytophthora megakarya]